jgi:hypothetical protein
LILFSNLDSLTLDEEEVSFVCKLKLTGKNVNQSIIFPDNMVIFSLYKIKKLIFSNDKKSPSLSHHARR